MYLTSFRGVRSTYEDCKYVQTVLHNFRVKVEEKDIYLNKIFYKELEDRLGEDGYYKLPVPQVFISGQRIGVCTSNTQSLALLITLFAGERRNRGTQ